MKKIKALVLSLLSLSVVGAFSGCSFEALLGMVGNSSESTPTNSESSNPEESTPDESTPDDGGEGDVTPDVPAADSLITIAKANELGLSKEHNKYTSDKFYVEGTVKSIDMDKNDPTKYSAYGNMYIEDAEGNTLYVYGVYGSQGKARFDSLKTKPAVGDTVKFYGVIGQYNGTAQMKNGWTMEINGAAQQDIAVPLSGTGKWDEDYINYDRYVIKKGLTYVCPAEEQAAVYGSLGYTLTQSSNGTYTVNIPDLNTGTVYISIDGVFDEIVDGYTFSAQADTALAIEVYAMNEDWQYVDAYFSLDFDANTYEANGSKLAPIAIANGSYTVGETSVFYTFTAPSAGYYKLSVNADWSLVEYSFNFYNVDETALLRGTPIAIAEGETITFFASNSTWNDDWTELLASEWTFSFGETLENDTDYDVPPVIGSYETPLEIYLTGDYEITIPAAENAYYVVLCDAFQFVVPTGTVAEVDYEITDSGNVVAFANYNMMWNSQLLVCFHIADRTATEDLTVSFTVTDYVAEDGGDDVEGNYIEVTTTDTYGFFDLYSFTAEAAGTYTFTVPAGLGFWSAEAKASNPYGGPEVEFYANESGDDVTVTLAAGETYEFYVGSLIKGDWIITWTVGEAGEDEGEGEEVCLVLVNGENTVVITAEDIASEAQGALYTYTATADGQYTFKSNSAGARIYDANMMMLGNGSAILTAGETYTVLVYSPMGAGTYTLTVEAPAGEDIGGGEEGGDEVVDTVLEVGSNKVVITEANNSIEDGALFTFVPTEKGLYQFAGDLMVIVYDSNLDPIERVNYKYELNANEEYYVVFYYMAMIGFQNEGNYTITVNFEAIVVEEPDDGDEGIDMFSAPIVTEANSETQVIYIVKLTETMNLTFTFDNADTWFHFVNVDNNQGVSGVRKSVYEGVCTAGTYELRIGTFTAESLTLTLTVTGTVVTPSEGGEEGDVVTYLTSHANGRKMKVVIDEANGTVSVTRSDMTGNFSGGATTYTGTYSFDGTTVTCEISGCTITWNADGSPATVNWTVVYDNFAIAE